MDKLKQIPTNLNHDSNRDWSKNHEKSNFKILALYLKTKEISPSEYPLACDLCAGEGAIASFLVRLGWDVENITCIDRYTPQQPHIDQSRFSYLDLMELYELLKEEKEIPDKFLKFQGKFDLVTQFYGFLDGGDEAEDLTAKFFLKSGGIAIIKGIPDLIIKKE